MWKTFYYYAFNVFFVFFSLYCVTFCIINPSAWKRKLNMLPYYICGVHYCATLIYYGDLLYIACDSVANHSVFKSICDLCNESLRKHSGYIL